MRGRLLSGILARPATGGPVTRRKAVIAIDGPAASGKSSTARWVVGENFDPKTFDWEGNRQTVEDRDGLPLVLLQDEWALQHAESKHPELKFLSAAPQIKGTKFVSVPA